MINELLQRFSRLEGLEWLQPENSRAAIWVNETSLREAVQCRDDIYISRAEHLGWADVLPFMQYPYGTLTDLYLLTDTKIPQ